MSFHQSSTLKRHRKTDIFHEMPFEKSLFLQVTPVAMMTTQKALSRKEFCSYIFTSFLAVLEWAGGQDLALFTETERR